MGGLAKKSENRASVHLTFDERPVEAGSKIKTKRWTVRLSAGAGYSLGQIRWFANWRRYVFAPDGGTIYDAICMDRIAEFCREETRKHDDAIRKRKRDASGD